MPPKSLAVEFDEMKIDGVFSEINLCHKPGAAVGIAINGKPVYRKGFGLANAELPIVLSPSIRMRIYSMSKQFTCLAYLLLCEDGKAGLDDPIAKHVSDLNPASQNVTIRQLMGHTSGLRDACAICWRLCGTGLSATSADIVSLYRDISDTSAPGGTSWGYNDGGYLLLTTAIEQITGRQFEDVLRERIFEPIGMSNTMLRRTDADFISNSASMHMTAFDGAYIRSYLGNMAGEGGIVSTVDDMLRWLNHMSAPVVGTTETWRLMKAPQVLANGTSTGYGLGLFVDKHRGVDLIRHGGVGMGANSQLIKLPDAGLDIVIMANRHDLHSVGFAKRIIDACVPGLDPVKEEAQEKLITGIYVSSKTGRVLHLHAAERSTPYIREGQQIANVDGVDIPLASNDDGTLFPSAGLGTSKIVLMPMSRGAHAASLKLSEYGTVDDFVLREPSVLTNARNVIGRYINVATGTEARIRDTDSGLMMKTEGRFGAAEFKLESLAEDCWRAKASMPTLFGGSLLFGADGSSFRYNSYGTVGLSFQRCG